MTEFFEACQNGQIDAVNNLLPSREIDDLNWGLSGACLGNHMNIVELLIFKGAYEYNWGFRNSCYGGHLEMTKFLIHKGASEYNSCLRGHINIVKLLISYNDNNSIYPLLINGGLSNACLRGHSDIINLLITNGASDYDRGLVNACYGGHLEIINLMIEKGATNWKESLFNACLGGHMNIVEFMFDKLHYNNLDILNNCLNYACSGGHRNIVELLIIRGANNWTEGLFNACYGKHKDLVLLMIIKGADIEDCYIELNFDDIYYLLQACATRWDINSSKKFSVLFDECKKYKLECSKILQEIIPIKDIVKIILKY